MKDPIAVIEAAYQVDISDSEWLEQLARVAATTFGSQQGGLAFQYDASSGDWVYVTSVAFQDLPREFVQQLFDQPAMSPEQQAEFVKVYRSISCGSILDTFNQIAPSLGQLLERYGMEDMVGINAIDPTGRGCMVSAVVKSRSYAPSTIELWRRLAAHVAAGNRLRRTLQALAKQDRDATSAAEAVMSPDGRMEHATEQAKEPEARDALRDALVRIDRARSRKETPTSSVELWRALVSGRWSIVEHFERDGKRYYLAHRNDPELAGDRALTPRERQVLAYAELGHSDKLIAYSLGLSASTVSTLLSSARRKLGSSLELMRRSSEAETRTKSSN